MSTSSFSNNTAEVALKPGAIAPDFTLKTTTWTLDAHILYNRPFEVSTRENVLLICIFILFLSTHCAN